MKGIVLVSHGKLAEGLLDSITMFFGKNLKQVAVLALQLDTAIEDFQEALQKKVQEVDDGDGVIILTDLFGGTPANQCAALMSDKVDVITGMNLPLLVELFNQRMLNVEDISKLTDTAKEGILHMNKLSAQQEAEFY